MFSATQTIRNRPKTILAVAAALTAVLGWQALRFHIDASPDTLLTPDNEHYLQTRLVSERFASDETLVIAYQPLERPLLSRASFDDLRALAGEIAALPRVESVRSLHNVPLPGADGDASQLESLTEASPGDLPPFDRLPELLRGHPIYEGLLVNREQTVAGVLVRFSREPKLADLQQQMLAIEEQTLEGELDDDQGESLDMLRRQAEPLEQAMSRAREREMTAVRDIVDGYQDNANVYLGGIHALEQGLIRIIEHDVAVFGTAMAVAICLILLVLFRSVRWMLIPVVICVVSVVCTIGLFVLFGLETTVISANFVALQLILTLAVAMHLMVEYQQTASKNTDLTPAAWLDATMRHKTRPCLYAGITTSVGFGSLLVSGIQPVISFGWMMIIAVSLSLVITLVLFPALATLLRPARLEKTGGGAARALLTRLAGAATRHRPAVLVASAVVFLWGLSGTFLLELENSFLDYFDESTRIHRELAFIDRHLGGTTPLDVVYTIPEAERESDLVLTADTVLTLQRIHAAIERQDGVGNVLSVTSFTALARRLNDDRPLTETELTAAYRLLPDQVRDELIGGFLAPEHHQVRFSAQIKDTTPGLDRSRLLDGIRAGLDDLGVPESRYTLSNLAVLYEDILSRLFTSQVATVAVVLAALLAAFWASFGSLSVALTALVPNVLATTSVFGVMGWLGIELDVMTITIAAVTMGIAVDDTIHYVHRYLEVRRRESVDQAIHAAHGTVGFAILYTTVIITLGFSLLTFSEFVPSVLFGALTGLAMVVALTADLTLLPVLLRRARVPGEQG